MAISEEKKKKKKKTSKFPQHMVTLMLFSQKSFLYESHWILFWSPSDQKFAPKEKKTLH
jgi:predicted NodU family carbamoyl transferase